jgi:hypothetical protein
VATISPLDAAGVYLSLNPLNPALLARGANRLVPLKTASTDADVLRIRHLLIDVDPVRPSGISATEEERQQAIAVRDAVHSYLDELEFPEPMVIMETGNGDGLIYAVYLPNDDESRALVDAALKSLASLFNTSAVTVDTGVGSSHPDRRRRHGDPCSLPMGPCPHAETAVSDGHLIPRSLRVGNLTSGALASGQAGQRTKPA